MSDWAESTADHVDALLRAQSRHATRQIPRPLPIPAANDPDDTAGIVATQSRPPARDLACRDWFVTGLLLGAIAGGSLVALFGWLLLLILA